MISQPECHRRRPVVIATHAIDQREPQGPMSPTEVVIEELQAHQRIPGVIAFGERVRLAGEGVEPITQSAIESFDMHGPRWLHPRPQRGADLHRQQSPMLITMLDRLRQRDRLWNHQAGTSPFARGDRFAVGPLQNAAIAMPAITPPMQFTPVSPLDRGGHRLLDQLLAQRASGTGDHEATLPILHQTSPALPLVGLAGYALFFWTNDQTSSISTWRRCRSLASTCVMAAAWLAARLSHSPIVSYLCPVISSA